MEVQYHALGYATQMSPKRVGYTPLAPALDLTTSLRGDLRSFFAEPIFAKGTKPEINMFFGVFFAENNTLDQELIISANN